MTERHEKPAPDDQTTDQNADERGQRLAGGAPEGVSEETTRDESSQTFAGDVGQKTGGGSG